MKKIGILTLHYSNNYGAVLQALALQKIIQSMGHEVEVIHYVPSSYSAAKKVGYIELIKKTIKKRYEDSRLISLIKKTIIIKKHSEKLINKFNAFRAKEMILSEMVDENLLLSMLNDYDAIVVGSDQVWCPYLRKRPEYYLNFGNRFVGNKISYAADSTVKDVDCEDLVNLKSALEEFNYISVRNKHSFEFVKAITGKEVEIVADPTILYNFDKYCLKNKERYILVYILGKEINGTHFKAIEKIKEKYGDLPVYSIKSPTTNFDLTCFADKTMYDLDPAEWLNLFTNASFVYTDSYHGVLFSLKFHKPFLAYYTERLRATRFIDLGERYCIDRYIVQSVDEIERKGSLNIKPDFDLTDKLLEKHRKISMAFLEKALDLTN